MGRGAQPDAHGLDRPLRRGVPNQIGPTYQYKTFNYTSGTAAGLSVFTIPLSVPPGEYEFRFLPNNGAVHAASLPITVTA